MKSECQFCGYKTNLQKFAHDQNRPEDKGQFMELCDICSSTPAGNSIQYPSGKDTYTLKTVCWIGNKLLDEVRKAAKKKTK